ncbi:IclR family transcriptional regulator [Pseudonocardia charpentierae]|uniref:IclR family transcriptional regulator C-terminal domain-containing protein n=1 Tax=Pseudonocardia charpentierae TaxID=3075545 RepID=A0ABU2NF08_9PSEU|nr:IclR family transcriptional regulator C-terminal domain-containing protein [Pseudonocardia sp. DSM 45834]MDT0352550.1 IclR family transcriptional regulator C-terminal domain-containing protein [Pseudonocardia sp. DSM 45834]
MAGNSKEPGRSVISKISAILLATTDGRGRTLTEIATWCGLPLSTVHRLATELAAWGLLDRDEEGRYRLGSQLRGPDVDELTAANELSLRNRIAPVMEELFRATGAPVRGGWLAGLEVAYVEKVLARAPVTQPCPAAQLPPHATALGKTLMAFSPTRVADAVIARGLRPYTRSTITRPERLRWAFRIIRATRIALCDRELDEGWCGIAAPVFGPGGTVVAAIELRLRDVAEDGPAVRAPLGVAAACLSRELTAQKPALVAPLAPWLAGRRDLVSIPPTRTAGAFRTMLPINTGRGMEPA